MKLKQGPVVFLFCFPPPFAPFLLVSSRHHTMTTKRFSDAFWGFSDTGFELLMERMKAAKHTCVELHAILSSRYTTSPPSYGSADMEEEYAKRLLKLSRSSTLGKDEDGLLRGALDTMRAELEAHGKSRMALAEELRNTLEKPMQVFLNKQRDVRKEVRLQY